MNINKSTLSGFIDVVMIIQPDDSLKCSPFHAHFGKKHILRNPTKFTASLKINDQPIPTILRIGKEGEVLFDHEFQPETAANQEEEKKSSEGDKESDNEEEKKEEDHEEEELKQYETKDNLMAPEDDLVDIAIL